MVAMTMSPRAMSALQRQARRRRCPICRRRGRQFETGQFLAQQDHSARAAAPARWLSIVTTTTRIGVGSAAVMRFGIVQRLDCYRRKSVGMREHLGVAARLAANEERNFFQFGLGLAFPR